MRFDYLLAFSVIGFAACATDEQPVDELPFAGDAGDAGKADHASVTTIDVDADIEYARLARGGTVILTSKTAWTRVMGTAAPASVDFSKEWIAFYGSGSKNTGGYSAAITGLSYSPWQRSLVLSTHATSPGADCLVTQAFTTPHHVVKFSIPSPRPLFALGDQSSEVRRCSPTNAERQAELADSRQAWDALKAMHGNSYTYTREFQSFTGFGGRTTIVVDHGTVTERHYKAQHLSGGEATQWTELGAQVGSHANEGFPAVVVDELYEQCRTQVLTQDEDANWMSFSLDDRGLLRSCQYTPMGCYDDCSHGPTISTLELTTL